MSHREQPGEALASLAANLPMVVRVEMLLQMMAVMLTTASPEQKEAVRRVPRGILLASIGKDPVLASAMVEQSMAVLATLDAIQALHDGQQALGQAAALSQSPPASGACNVVPLR
jgi:hypothetical protein